MAKKRQYTVRVSYKVYDYYNVDATSEEKAIEKALEKAGDDSLNDFMQEGEGEGVVTIVDGKPTEPKRDKEPEKVYVFTADQAWDGEVADTIVRTFRTREAAREFMHKFIHNSMNDESTADYVKRKGWEVEVDEPDLYRAYPDGYYPTNHIELTITECNIE